MKILIVSDAWYPQLNGVVRTYEHLRDELEAQGHYVKVMGPKDFPMRMPMPGYSEIKLAIGPYGRLRDLIDFLEPEHLHIATEGPLGYAARRYAIKKELHFTTSYHTHFPDYAAKRVKKYIPGLADWTRDKAIQMIRNFHAPSHTMFVASPSLEEELRSWNFENPMTRLTRGVDLELFKPAPKTLFQDLKGPVALYVGRVAIEKSIHKFLEMGWPGSKVVVGHGPSMGYFKKRYPDAHFVGKKTGVDLVVHYQSSDVFVFPSKTDTFGIVLIEALACGLPVAGYNVTGPKDIITAPSLGALTDEDDLGACAQKALDAPGSKEERHLHVKENYSWAKAAEQFMSVIKR